MARAMRVPTQDCHRLVWMSRHELNQDVAHGFAGKVWCPVVIRKLALVPTCFAERWNMCEYHNALARFQSLRKHLAKVVGCFVSQRAKFRVHLRRQD